MSEQSPRLSTAAQHKKILKLAEGLSYDEIDMDVLKEELDSMSYETAQGTIKNMSIELAHQNTPHVDQVDFAAMNARAVAAYHDAISQALATTKVFGQTPAQKVEAPVPDSDYLKKQNLIGVTFTCLNVDVHESTFVNDNPKKKRTLVAEYKVIIDQRPDLGERIVSLGNPISISQASALSFNDFPFKATLEYGESKGSFNPPFLMASPRNASEQYYHPSETQSGIVNSDFPY